MFSKLPVSYKEINNATVSQLLPEVSGKYNFFKIIP
jgi:hypothetical protein